MHFQWLRSLLFNIQLYTAMIVIAIVCFPLAILSPAGARTGLKAVCRWAIWTAGWMLNLRCEVRGNIPTGEVLVAAKHQSFLDIFVIFNALPDARFIMKRELMFVPLGGLYAWRIGCVPVNRGKRGAAIGKMLADVEKRGASTGQLVIYPQGTRVAPGATLAYKVGSHVLYDQLQKPCVPVATNVGVFWPKRGVLRKPGLAVVEFLDPIAPGVAKPDFMQRLEAEVEHHSNRLMTEAGFAQPMEGS